MKKPTITTFLLLFSATTLASNACLIDGATVFQKAPCPIQEGVNLTGEIRDHRRTKERKKMIEAHQEQALNKAEKAKVDAAREKYRNSPEGKAERNARINRIRDAENANILRRLDNKLRFGL